MPQKQSRLWELRGKDRGSLMGVGFKPHLTGLESIQEVKNVFCTVCRETQSE